MHIPDGYLSPGSCLVSYAAMVPVWYVASRRVEKAVSRAQVPVLALGAAFTFVIMMFNIPIPGGSSGHMVGTAVVAAVLGPWAGVVAITLALTLQAFIFADGGITTLAANCFNMGVVMSFSGYFVYAALASGSPSGARRFVSAAAAGFVAVNAAALCVALELGVQPLIAHAPDGTPLYAPYPLGVAVPAMMISHLVFFGPVEAVGTALAVSYVARTNASALKGAEAALSPLWAALLVLIFITPLGLLASGTPWGEWGRAELMGLLGYLPSGVERLEGAWPGVMPDYGQAGDGDGAAGALYYILAAFAGSALTVAAVYIWGRLWRR